MSPRPRRGGLASSYPPSGATACRQVLSEGRWASRSGSTARKTTNQSEVHHIVRHLERLPIGTPFPEIARRAAEVSAGIEHRAGYGPEIFVDATGLGQPMVDLLDEAMPRVRAISAVFFTHGDRRIETRSGLTTEVQLGKAHLVCRLQTLLQCQRLHLPRTPEAETLAQELLEYEIRVESDANEHYGAFRVGTHDELVTALGLAVQRDPVGPGIF